jgi:hypothetical protein
MKGLLSKERITARPDFSRWWMVPAALAIISASARLHTRGNRA